MKIATNTNFMSKESQISKDWAFSWYRILQTFIIFFFFTFLNFFIFEMFLHSSWGETFFMCIQDIIITVLTFYYGGSTFSALLFAPVYIGINYVLSNPALTPFSVILKLQEFNLVVLLISRVSFVYFFH